MEAREHDETNESNGLKTTTTTSNGFTTSALDEHSKKTQLMSTAERRQSADHHLSERPDKNNTQILIDKQQEEEEEEEAIKNSRENAVQPLQQAPPNGQLEDGHSNKAQAPNISDLIGEFGLYQLSLAIITLIRYVCVAMMTNTGPLLAPSLTYWCLLPGQELGANYGATVEATRSLYLRSHNDSALEDALKNKCQFELAGGGLHECTAWKFNTSEVGVTLTDSFNLVCDRNWLRSAFQSSVSFGVVIASVLFGSFSDEHGRRLTMLVSCAISLGAGLVSCWAPNFLTYTLARSLCSMCDLGIVGSLYTTIVETLGNKFRGPTCLIVFTGWSLGVMIMPWITSYFQDFRQVMYFTVACHLLTLPWCLTVGESIRWLLVNGRLREAHQEIRRICAWNSFGKAQKRRQQLMSDVDESFELLKVKYERMASERDDASIKARNCSSSRQVLKRTFFGGLSKVGQIFKSRELTITTAMIIWTTFNSELLYMLFIMINSDVGENVKLNYAIGGLVETLATLISIFLIAWLTRRLSLCSTLSIISASMLCLAFTHQSPAASVWALNFTKLAISTLSSLVYVIVTELFPTSLRQTGMGLAGTLGSLGAVIAPFIRTELVDAIGMTSVMLALCLLPLSAALLIPFFLPETSGIELADDVNDISRASAANDDDHHHHHHHHVEQQHKTSDSCRKVE